MNKILILAVALLNLGFTQANVPTLFKSLDSAQKGPFGPNILQGASTRVLVTETPPADFQFQAAYRNNIARQLVEQENFYVGNLFTTNYYALMGEFVYHDAYGSHKLDHAALLAEGPQAMAKAEFMVRSWVLEKHFVAFFPASKLARSFRIRGIGGSEFEQPYAVHFLNFYLSSLTSEFQFLPAYLLAKSSPVASAPTLERARNLMTIAFDKTKETFETSNPKRVARLYAIRNAVHNQLSPEISAMIDKYIQDFPASATDSHSGILAVKDILINYYRVSAARVVDLANKLGLNQVVTEATKLTTTDGKTISNMLALSRAIADVRTNLATVPSAKKTNTLLLLISACEYINKEMSLLKNLDQKEAIEIVINSIYTEGFLIKDNWQYFVSEVRNSPDPQAATTLLSDVIDTAIVTLNKSFAKTLEQWLSVEPKMQYFVDNTLKSSSLKSSSVSVARMLLRKLRR